VLSSVAPTTVEYIPTWQYFASPSDVAAVTFPYIPAGNDTHWLE
jgi:hypothetical protein